MIEQIKQALDKATQGPWVIGDIPQGDQYLKSVTNKVGIVGNCLLTEDAQLIANAPEWLRYLIGEVERLQNERDNALSLRNISVKHYNTVKEENEQLQKSLKWYADKQNYEFYGMGVVINEDKGEIARQTLERSKS